jgi:hypothetical protein
MFSTDINLMLVMPDDVIITAADKHIGQSALEAVFAVYCTV